jgi:hypothetical protein
VSLLEPVLHEAASSIATTATIPIATEPLNLYTKSNLPGIDPAVAPRACPGALRR